MPKDPWYKNLLEFAPLVTQRPEPETRSAIEVPREEKEFVAAGGFEVLRRIVAPELGTEALLNKYRTSLYVYACVSKIAEKVGSINFRAYRVKNSRGDTEEILSHPALDLLYRPNPFQTKAEFLQITVINLKTVGIAYWFKVRNDRGDVVELWNLRPDWVTAIADPVLFIKQYKFARSDGKVIDISPEDVVVHKYPDPLSPYIGLSPLRPGSLSVEIEEYSARFQRDFFLNNARPDAILKDKNSDMTKEQKDEVREQIDKRHRGIGKSSKLMILGGDLDYQVVSLTQKEMDWIETKKLSRDDVLAMMKVPKPLLAIVDDVNRANSETAMYIFLSETVKPDVEALTEKYNEECVYTDFDERVFIGFDDPTPENRETKRLEYESGIQNNYMLINEVRQQLGLPPVAGGWSFYMPILSAPAGGLAQNGQKALEMVSDSDTNEAIVKAAAAEKTQARTTYRFKGRHAFRQKLVLSEKIQELLKAGLVKAAKKKRDEKNKKGKGSKGGSGPALKGVSLIQKPELRQAYAAMINKGLDNKTAQLKAATDDFATAQRGRVVAALKDRAKSAGRLRKKVSVKVTEIFDAAREDGIAIDFIVPYITSYVKQAGLQALNQVAPAEDFVDTPAIKKFIEQRAAEFADNVNSTTLDGLEQTLAEGIANGEGVSQLATRVETVYSDFPSYRSERIARTEATASTNQGMLEGFRQSGVANAKEWINAGDSRVRIEHQDEPVGVGAEIVALDALFTNGLGFPQEINCRCVLGPAFLE